MASKQKNSKDALEFIHRLDSLAIQKQKDEIDHLKAEVEAQAKRWAESEDLILHYKQQRDEAYNDCECHRLKAEVERLRKAVMHSPAAQLKLKELEGKTTYEEINPDSNGF